MLPHNKIYLLRIFNQLDKNGDGVVSIDELMWLLKRTGVNPQRAEIELLVGKDALNSIEFTFFYETVMIKGNLDQERYSISDSFDCEIIERDLRKAFRVFDLNDDGFISSDELKIALLRLGLWEEQDCNRMIGFYDTNSDGLLDFQEFKDMMLLADRS